MKRFYREIYVVIMGGLVILTAAIWSWVRGASDISPLPKLYTNQAYVEDVRRSGVDLTQVDEVFAFVFSQLPGDVRVYPTENYYYYRFFNGGNEIWGNIRLDVEDREVGLVSFAYFTFTEQSDYSGGPEPVSGHKNMGAPDGLTITKRDRFIYDLTYRGKTVTFYLNNLEQALPQQLQLTADEEFLFRLFDESGFQFVFVYDHRANAFRYILDPTAPLADVLQEVASSIVVGYRTGFAFYTDVERGRRVLIAVRQENVRRNNYYDGPFDQLADNWLAETKFQEYASGIYSSTILSPRGYFLNEHQEKVGNRLAVQAYMQYSSVSQLTWLLWHCENQEGYFLGCLTRDPNTYSD